MKKISEIMIRDLTAVTKDTPLKEAAEILALRELAGIPVVNENNEVCGWLSEADIIYSIFPEKVKLGNPNVIGLQSLSHLLKKIPQGGPARVRDYMSKNVCYVNESTRLADAAELMLNKNFTFLPVVRDKNLVGVVSRAGIFKTMLEEGSVE